MPPTDVRSLLASGPSTRTLWLVALTVVSVPLVVPAQILAIVVFDSAGLDAVLPDLALFVLAPAVAVALVPATWALRRGLGRRAVPVVLVGLAVAAWVAAVTIDFYALCGRC